MCGLAAMVRLDPDAKGFAGRANYKIFGGAITSRDELFRDIAKEADSRGGDGHGLTLVAPCTWDGHTKIVSTTLRSSVFRSLDQFTTWGKLGPFSIGGAIDTAPLAILHTRKASSGGSTLAVTHPIVSEQAEIMMSHNGTLRNWETNFTKKDMPISDTAAIVRTLLEKGAKETFESLEGPMTCMWLEPSKGLFHIHRSEGRPLHYVDYEGFRYFASEGWMLYKAFDKNSADMSKVDIKEYPANVHTAWSVATGEEVLSETYKPKPLSSNTSYSCGTNYVHNSYHHHGTDNDIPSGSRKSWKKSRHAALPKVSPKLIPEPEGVCSLKRDDWVIVEPYQAIQQTTHGSTSKLLSYIDSREPFNNLLTEKALDVWSFSVANDLAESLVRHPYIKLAVICTGVSNNPIGREPDYSKAIIAQMNQCLPIIEWSYEMSVDEATSLREIVKRLYSCAIKFGNRQVTGVNGVSDWKSTQVDPMYKFVDDALAAWADDDVDTLDKLLKPGECFTKYTPREITQLHYFYEEA